MSAPPATPRPPAPLLPVALGLMAGIACAEAAGPLPPAARPVVWAGPFIVFAVMIVAAWYRPGAVVPVPWILAGVLALTVGFARQQSARILPADSIAHTLAEEPTLTRLRGRVVTRPVAQPAEHHNPFLPFELPPRTRFVFAVDELCATEPGTPASGLLRVSVEGEIPALAPGQRVQITGRAWLPRGPRNPGERDWRPWYRHQGLAGGLSVSGGAHVQVLPDPVSNWQRMLNMLRSVAQQLLLEPVAAAETDARTRLLDVMVLGQRSAADRKLNEAFQRAGGMHFLAASGFHVGLLAALAYGLTRHVLRRSARGAALAMLVTTVLYALVAEPNAPILRAATVVIMIAWSTLRDRPVALLNWLSLGVLAILLVSPGELCRAGFQLSFVIVLGLVYFVPRRVPAPVYHHVFRPRAGDLLRPVHEVEEARHLVPFVWLAAERLVLGTAIVCAIAYLVALPLVLLHFGRFAPWGWLGTGLLSPLVVLTIALSFVTMLAGAVIPPLGAGLGGVLAGVTDALLGVVGWLSKWPAAVIDVAPPPAWLVVATYAAAGACAALRPDLVWLARARFTLRSVLLMGVPALVLVGWAAWLVLPPAPLPRGPALHVLAVGDGSTTLVTAPGRRAAVLDVGTDTNSDVGRLALDALRALHARAPDTVLCSHANFDHYSGVPTLLGARRSATWYVSRDFLRVWADPDQLRDLKRAMPAGSPDPKPLQAGRQLAIGTVGFDVLWPPGELGPGWAVNNTSLVLRVTLDDVRVLFPGDIEDAALRALLAAQYAGPLDLSADVLIAPHHGEVIPGLTGPFLRAVGPRCVVVSSRRPRPQLDALVLETLGPDVQVLRTGEVGAVQIRRDPDLGLWIETPYAPPDASRPEPVALQFAEHRV